MVLAALLPLEVPHYVVLILVLALALVLGWKLLKLAFRVALVAAILLVLWFLLSRLGFVPGPG